MRNCADYQLWLSLYIDNCLEDHEKAQLEEHLNSCPQCRKELQELQETVSIFNSLAEEEFIPPASFRIELHQKLKKEQKAQKITFMDKVIDFVGKKPRWVWMPLTVAVLFLFIIVPMVNNFNSFDMNAFYSEGVKEEMAPRENFENKVSFQETLDIAPKQEMASLRAGESAMGMMAEEEGKTLAKDVSAVERKIIKTGHINLQVDSYKKTALEVNSMVDEMNGYIVQENTYVYDPNHKLLKGNIAIRIPVERFEEALSRLENMGNTNNRSVDSQDVTEEYVDVESRLNAMRLKEERLLAILNKSGTLGDILAVENELAKTRADLEALEGRLRYLNNRTELSTINVSISETLTPVKQIKTTGLEGVFARSQEAFIKSINSIIISMGNMVVYLGAFLPFVIIGIITLIILLIILNKVRKKYFGSK